MEKIRVAHLADLHIGGKIFEKSKLKESVEKNLIKGLLEIFTLLKASKVKYLLIAGDFYESSNVDTYLLKEIKEIFSKFDGKIVISPGNHDYYSIDSPYNTMWPENTYIFKSEKIEFLEFLEDNLRIYGCAFEKSYVRKRVLDFDFNLDKNFINIGVFHGQIDSVKNNYAPIFLKDIEKSGFDYLALGHIHQRSEITKIGDTYFSYSGNPVGRGFDETGEKGIYLGDISKNRNGLNFYKLNSSQFLKIGIEIKNFESQEIIEAGIRGYLRENFGENYQKHFYKIYIEGYRDEDMSVNLEILETNLSDLNYVEIYDHTRLKIDLESLSKEDSFFAKFVKNVLSSEYENKEEIVEIAIKASEDRL